jgi:hypothetical protein
MDDKETKTLLQQFDHDNDGVIQLDEFIVTMCQRDKEGKGENAVLTLDSLVGLPTFMMSGKVGKTVDITGHNLLERTAINFLQWRYNIHTRVSEITSQVSASRMSSRRTTQIASAANAVGRRITHASHIIKPGLRRMSNKVNPSSRRNSALPKRPSQGGQHVLSDESRRRIQSVERVSCLWAGFAGVLSAVAAGAVEVAVEGHVSGDAGVSEGILGFLEKCGITKVQLMYVLPVVVFFSILEIVIVYAVGLTGVLETTKEVFLFLAVGSHFPIGSFLPHLIPYFRIRRGSSCSQ